MVNFSLSMENIDCQNLVAKSTPDRNNWLTNCDWRINEFATKLHCKLQRKLEAPLLLFLTLCNQLLPVNIPFWLS